MKCSRLGPSFSLVFCGTSGDGCTVDDEHSRYAYFKCSHSHGRRLTDLNILSVICIYNLCISTKDKKNKHSVWQIESATYLRVTLSEEGCIQYSDVCKNQIYKILQSCISFQYPIRTENVLAMFIKHNLYFPQKQDISSEI